MGVDGERGTETKTSTQVDAWWVTGNAPFCEGGRWEKHTDKDFTSGGRAVGDRERPFLSRCIMRFTGSGLITPEKWYTLYDQDLFLLLLLRSECFYSYGQV